ncbi:MAG: stress response translation initiation inhibitor YciH [Gammaproteobacteria bacterium]|nr:stress response translation initiation inhibitor YciH [Gammaproteobacteria bacterium]
MSSYSKRVYSTESANQCPKCGKALKSCRCDELVAGSAAKTDGNVRVFRETKGRKGSGVSLISGLVLNEKELKSLAKQLKKLCGSGGAVKNGIIEIQGEHRDKLVAELNRLGYKALKSGG